MQPENNTNDTNTIQPPEVITETYTPKPDDQTVNPTEQVDTQIQTEPEEVKTEPTKKPIANEEPVHWQATEYIHGEKNGIWYILFGIVVLGFIAVDIFLMKSYTFSILIVVMAIAMIVYSRRPPRMVDYTLSGNQGLYVGERLYHFSDFKAFGIIKDNDQHSIMLIPTKRFSPGVSVYFPEEVGEKVVDILGARLPMETLKLDVVDIIVRKLHL